MSILSRIKNLMATPTVVQISLSSDAPTQVINYTAKKLYTSQDNLKAVVDFLSNSVAQLPLKVYKRDDETTRKRDRDSTAAKLLYMPNSDQTAFEFIRGVAMEYFIFGCVYVWLMPDANSASGYQMRIIPSEWVTETIGGTAYAPDAIRVQTKSTRQKSKPMSRRRTWSKNPQMWQTSKSPKRHP
jgi:phage portal protein BeeE